MMVSGTKKQMIPSPHDRLSAGRKETDGSMMPTGWKKLTIADVGEIITGGTPPTSKTAYYAGDKLFITPSDFTDDIYITRSSRTVSDAAYRVSRIIPPNSIYVVCIGTVGKINMCASAAICNQQINSIVPHKSYSSQFLYYCIDYFFNLEKKKYIGIQTLPIIRKSLFARIHLWIPPIGEQQKIAKILFSQDKVIELCNRKLGQLKFLKALCLKKMLPQYGESIPKARFPGFVKSWVERRFDDVFREYSIKGYPQQPVLTIIQGGGTVRREEADRRLQYDKNSLSHYKMAYKDDFIVHLRSFEGGLEKVAMPGIVSPA